MRDDKQNLIFKLFSDRTIISQNGKNSQTPGKGQSEKEGDHDQDHNYDQDYNNDHEEEQNHIQGQDCSQDKQVVPGQIRPTREDQGKKVLTVALVWSIDCRQLSTKMGILRG